MGQAQPKRRTALVVEDDAELRSLTAALLEEEQLERESAEAALAVPLIGHIAMIFADMRLPRAMAATLEPFGVRQKKSGTRAIPIEARHP
jgi:CheY-like chemotaxis protein